MVALALLLFAGAALGGVFMTFIHLRGSNPPTPLAIIHGLAASGGVVLLILAFLLGSATPLAGTALVLFVLAALGGAFMFLLQHLRNKRLSTPIVLIHAGVAVVAVLVLLVGALSSLSLG
jgi:hypothetical protein